MSTLGPYLCSLPDGETGERRNWIIPIIDSLRSHQDLELAKDGDWSDYDKTPRLRVRPPRRVARIRAERKPGRAAPLWNSETWTLTQP